jgi:hypothetical protein
MHKGIITGHFMFHWGVPSDIRPIEVAGIMDFAILEFAPDGPRTTWRYATNGMSYLQAHPDDHVKVRTELYASTKLRAPWILELLRAIASYPMDYATYLAEGDTINVVQPIDRQSSCFTGVLLAPAEPPTLGLVAGTPENILVHQIVGLLTAEVQLAETLGGGSMLWQRLLNAGEHMLDEERLPVA